MRSVGWRTYLLTGLSLVFAVFAFWRCYSGRFQPVTPNMLINSGLSIPYAAEQDFLSVTKCCLRHSASWLEQMTFYAMHHDDALADTKSLYFVYAIGAALACIMVFRVGSACINAYVGLLASLLLACMPLQNWANCAFTAALVLFNWDRLLSALKFNTYLTWALYFLSSIMMLFNCFFTETVLLQWWFGAQLAALLIRYAIVPRHHRSPYFLSSDIRPRVLVRGESHVKDVYVFLGINIAVGISLAVVSLMVYSFAIQRDMHMRTFFMIILRSLGLVMVMGTVYILMPNHQELKEKFIKYVQRLLDRIFNQQPERTFFHTRISQLGLALGVYALAIMAFAPFVLKIYGIQMRFFVSNGLAAYQAFSEDAGLLVKWAPIAPFVCAAFAFALYRMKKLHSQDACGILSICCFAILFVFQQRYAPISAPFFVLSVLAVPYLVIKLALGSKAEEPPEEEADA
jgi:hypothetical protein